MSDLLALATTAAFFWQNQYKHLKVRYHEVWETSVKMGESNGQKQARTGRKQARDNLMRD